MRLVILLVITVLTGCAVPSPAERARVAEKLAIQAGWRPVRLHTSMFTLAAYVPQQLSRPETLTVYIEGDGLAWVSRSRVSQNPTPGNPTALELALRHPNLAVAYLARPCQFVDSGDARHCAIPYWTDRRFAPEVIASMNEAVGQLKAQAGALKISLVGFSGGAAIAALVAARRDDVKTLITVAGNLDTEAWTQYHHVPRLAGSLNPADAWRALANVPQVHFIGADDRIITRETIEPYLRRFPAGQRPELRLVQGMGHHCCWAQHWPALAKTILD